MSMILGSKFEASFRLLILFEAACNDELTEHEATALDFMTVYSRDFGICDSNLHGDSNYRFGEFTSRRLLIREAIKRLVLDRLLDVLQTKDGFKYKLSAEGHEFVSNLESEYAETYYETAQQVITAVGKSNKTLSEIINQKVVASMRREKTNG